MKAIILLAGYGTRMRPHTWSRPKALMKVAGNTTIGHLLDLMMPILTEEVIFVVGYRGEQIREWIDENYPQLDTHYVVQENALGQAHAVALCREFLEKPGEVVVGFGDGVVKADYAAYQAIAGNEADAVLTVQEVPDPRPFGVVALDEAGFVTQFIEKPDNFDNKNAAVGINWFRSGPRLMAAIDRMMDEGRMTKGEYYMADAYQVLLEEGAKMKTMQVDYWLDAGKPAHILDTNIRLLGLGQGVTEDAIERAYGEGFTVIPPVFIAESAEITASIIGPYAHIDDNAVIDNAIIRNSIIDPRATVSNTILDNALVGEDAIVKGASQKLFVGDKSVVDLS
ncbi:MAG TPA: nucleotidyltransferase [Anaerolineae bacterium]|nr:nucleotidyltransferase [Anaerolineae bacterium]